MNRRLVAIVLILLGATSLVWYYSLLYSWAPQREDRRLLHIEVVVVDATLNEPLAFVDVCVFDLSPSIPLPKGYTELITCEATDEKGYAHIRLVADPHDKDIIITLCNPEYYTTKPIHLNELNWDYTRLDPHAFIYIFAYRYPESIRKWANSTLEGE